MANITPTVETIQTVYGHVHRVTWVMANGDVGVGPNGSDLGYGAPASSDRSVQVIVTGTAGTLTFQGTNGSLTSTASPTWATLTDPLGNNLTFTATGFKQLNEVSIGVRPSHTGGDGTTAITVILCSRGTL